MSAGGAHQLILDLPHRPASGADDFLVAPSNAEAVAWLDRWPDWAAPGLALHGPTGCGKTHLLRVWQARSGAGLIQPTDLGGLDFSGLAIAPEPMAVDACEEALPERALLHLYNLLAGTGGCLLLA
ncbi:MAG: HdaA/DnaA family protein, partial [Pseudomonadota bacterium]